MGGIVTFLIQMMTNLCPEVDMYHGNLDALWVHNHCIELYHPRVSCFDIWKELRLWFISVLLFTQSYYGLSSPHSVCYKIDVTSSVMILLFIKFQQYRVFLL